MSVVASALVDAQSPFLGLDNGQYLEYVYFQLTIAGIYVAGGDALDFTKLGDVLKSSRPPIQVNLWSQSGTLGHSGFTYYYRPGNPATQANGKLQVLVPQGSGSAMAEIAASAYPAGVLADTVVGVAVFIRI